MKPLLSVKFKTKCRANVFCTKNDVSVKSLVSVFLTLEDRNKPAYVKLVSLFHIIFQCLWILCCEKIFGSAEYLPGVKIYRLEVIRLKFDSRHHYFRFFFHRKLMGNWRYTKLSIFLSRFSPSI